MFLYIGTDSECSRSLATMSFTLWKSLGKKKPKKITLMDLEEEITQSSLNIEVQSHKQVHQAEAM